MCKHILYQQGWVQESFTADILRPPFINFTNKNFLEDTGGNAVYVELRNYEEEDYILETIVVTNHEVTRTKECLSEQHPYKHIRFAIERFDDLSKHHPFYIYYLNNKDDEENE